MLLASGFLLQLPYTTTTPMSIVRGNDSHAPSRPGRLEQHSGSTLLTRDLTYVGLHTEVHDEAFMKFAAVPSWLVVMIS